MPILASLTDQRRAEVEAKRRAGDRPTPAPADMPLTNYLPIQKNSEIT